MNILEELEQVKKEVESLNKEWFDFKNDFDANLIELLQSYTHDSKLRIIREKFIEDCNYFDKKHKYRLNLSIYFKKSENENDFGSEFELYIYDNEIGINRSGIGIYTKETEPYMVKCDYFVVELWKHEQELVNFVANNYNFELEKRYIKSFFKQREIESRIKQMERDFKINQTNAKLVVGAKFVDRENDIYTITRITPKKYYYTCEGYTCEMNTKKEDLVLDIAIREKYKLVA